MDQSRIKRGTEVDQLRQSAEAFRAITEVWLEHCGTDESVKSDRQSKETPADQLFEPSLGQNESPLASKILEEAADLSFEELNRLRIQLAKAFLKEIDNKLALERINQGHFKAKTIFD